MKFYRIYGYVDMEVEAGSEREALDIFAENYIGEVMDVIDVEELEEDEEDE